MKVKYCFNIPEGGSQSLGILDYCFNESTQAFLLKSGLSQGMKVLEIGCGSGKMSCWIAKKIGQDGQLIAIDNSQNQIEAALAYADSNKLTNAFFKCHDAYDICDLNTTFDLVYCRFVLHHLSQPREVINNIHALLKPNGIAVIEEGIVNNAFTYPYNTAFGNERFEILDRHENFEGKQRDGNFGIKLWHTLNQAGFNKLLLNIVSPALTSKTEKAMLKPGLIDSKQNALENGLSEKAWQNQLNQLNQLIEDDSAIVGFYQSIQVSGIKGNSE
jgi:SAM-dependent methyltransferase